MKSAFAIAILFFLSQVSLAQEEVQYKWWNPAENEFKVIEGQAWPGLVDSIYHRLPKEAEQLVRKPLWNLSKHSAGLLIRFISNAPEIRIKYEVNGPKSMPHMPATGVSGVDLYSKNADGQWLWNRGGRTFGDTVVYHYRNINPNARYHKKGKEYQLYLPLYNSVDWLEIGVPEGSIFEPLPLRKEKPLVVYGTSIAQGACASRPGMAWTSILQRNLDRPLINLAFSGNGMLEDPMINYLTEIDAKLYILDCLPNLGPNKKLSNQEVYNRIISSVRKLKAAKPLTPILLTEHAGYSDGATNMARQEIYSNLNRLLRKAFLQLQGEGFKGLRMLHMGQIGLTIDSFVDGTHPSDLGMIEYAEAYEGIIREILNEPLSGFGTTVPVTQYRGANTYSWGQRHQELLTLNKSTPANIAFFGNSITHHWGGTPEGPINRGADSWEANFKDLGVRNFGFGWDRIENALWRVYHDELDDFNGDQIVLMLGTNNLQVNSDLDIAEGLRNLVQVIKSRKPDASILLLGILPRRGQEERIYKLNAVISRVTSILEVNYADVGRIFLKEDDKIDESLFGDGLHPNTAGYQKLGAEIRKHLLK